ncbi:hypothetical protein QBC35DRAFT_524039 [Podospora australis]|uniref:Aminoglycoside phosphotransferase domain-containing protein n=1 Tax=Podospora australis TaxID=1536484 RepID=A0AAN7AI11_9PEZI|nr:hypothetical protein QBC35DRAFT_524039 [Podospora australis]
MPLVSSDNDFPKSLNTANKQVKMAKKLVAEHLGSPSKRIDRAQPQGMFSRTFLVTLADDPKSALGALVPRIQHYENKALEEEGAWVYCMERLLGKTWLQGITSKGDQGRVTVSKSVGRVFAKGYLEGNSTSALPLIRARLEAMIASPLQDIQPFKPQIQTHLDNLDKFAQLPLWVSHYDLNEVNVLIDDNCEVTGLIDWELSTPLPFGVSFGRVHTIAGEYSGGEFCMHDRFEEAERGFWDELLKGIPDAKVRRSLHDNMGTLLDCFVQEDPQNEVGCSKVTVRALPKFLTYRIPFARGDEPRYRI